ncbi:tocopherol cyclase family protein [Pseudoflavonifractor phocaeensis]|uniref:tocopherol cyclase family protein n=1 Tax=Pseudoflavonifractor phocaeensis TaxID=1870988 RepID=UPI001F2C0A08|nr:tocopherol cyclase family protein [Pseudoflavonifractor phocaeensis]MCF2595329.1 hypothetical protein [Pseudoflavonifractor phocaeensis]
MKYYHGADRRGAYFEGWYLKHQGAEGEFAVIPAFHRDRRGTESASIQVVTRGAGKLFTFPARSFQAWPDRFQVRVGANWFSQEGLHLELEEPGFSLRGDLRYGPFHPLTSDIMGPFRFAPGLPCVHGVLSMEHRVDGMVSLNGAPCFFSRGKGYAETDRGRSFPSQYLWTQCSWQERQRGSLMLSLARIPLPVGSFTGCIGEICFAGSSYRLATYRGVRIEAWSEAGASIRQGELRLTVEVLDRAPAELMAPERGSMSRVIRESLCARVRYRFWEGERLVFDHEDDRASFEYAGSD